jgi:hypothetical protein
VVYFFVNEFVFPADAAEWTQKLSACDGVQLMVYVLPDADRK